MPCARDNRFLPPRAPGISAAAAHAATIAALTEALEDEYKARATYRAVIDAFGAIRPFVNIVESEGRHVEALIELFRRRRVIPPEDRWMGRIKAPPSIARACRDAVAAEIENGIMYDRLLEIVDDDDARRVLRNLRRASQDRHLAAFRRCAATAPSRPAARSRPSTRRRRR